ncbi:IPT/TIG domain-containing protein [Flavobacterium psychroterrae]|uniref:IPT/TIG domain-containing protein n=1 Tax=Flavobacterium psychroterrae TaxID=2133767 RepID=A0ABS5PFG2_9FLAO|nr:IPT/TIG domain-containing protein [Flavobacterium psychroterrae]MBS7233043.1 IPT/TIG domain-containing protein [Flavobacterium psychroterrae]
MKKRILLVAVLQLFIVFNSCSGPESEPAVTPEEPPVVVIKTAKLTSYSKNSGETGETVSIYGENFSEKVSDTKITFDGVAATIVSATATEIKFTIPKTEKVLPKLQLTIENRTISNEIKNDYEGNIGILPVHSLTEWVAQENTAQYDVARGNIQMINDKIVYIAGSLRTFDGGITWGQWARGGFSLEAHATKNDEGWASSTELTRMTKIKAGGDLGNNIFANIANTTEVYYCIYVDDNMKDGTVVTQKGRVFTTSNGVDFTKVYELEDDTANLFQSTKIDNDHMWVIGYKKIKDKDGFNLERPFILFKNNTTDGWKEYPFVNEAPGYYAREISFVDKQNGFLLINHYYNALLDVKLFKTNNGGDSWSQIYDGEMFSKFTFKDVNTGWAILDNKIYKTTNGGTTWTLDYTHDQTIGNISYKNNVVWAFSKDKIIKRYL